MPAGPTYEPIATTTLSSAQSTITFSSIPNTYTDLRLVVVAKGSSTGDDILLRFNSDTATNYSYTLIYGNGTTASSNRATSVTSLNWTNFGQGIASTYSPHLYTADVFSYAGSTFKTVLMTGSEDENGSGYSGSRVGLWRSTTAISSVSVLAATFQLAAGTTATLYGIKAA